MNENISFKILFCFFKKKKNSLIWSKTSAHIVFRPKRTILLTLMETSHKSFKETKKIKRKCKTNPASTNSIIFSGFGLYKLWLFILPNDGDLKYFKTSICYIRYTSIDLSLFSLYRHKINWNWPQKQDNLSCNERRGKWQPFQTVLKSSSHFSCQMLNQTSNCGILTTHIALHIDVCTDNMDFNWSSSHFSTYKHLIFSLPEISHFTDSAASEQCIN